MSGGHRIAAVHVPALALQLLLRVHPDWSSCPVAVVDRELPTGRVLWVNRQARRCGVRVGMRYGAGLALSAELRAGAVAPREVAAASEGILGVLGGFSPGVEASEAHEGLYWVNAEGLSGLYPSLRGWADEIDAALGACGYRATIVVGFGRFAVGALARARYRSCVLEDPAEERRAMLQVPVGRLGLPPAALRAVERLGLRTLGDVLALPRSQVVQRLGEAVAALHRQVNEGELLALRSTPLPPQFRRRLDLDHGTRDVQRLLHHVERLLVELLEELRSRDAELVVLGLGLELERAAGMRHGDRLEEEIRPAEATLDADLLLELIGLRLGALRLSRGVVGVSLCAEAHRIVREQPVLFALRPARDLAAANRALARVRAELGDEAVGTLTPGNGHLPEAQCVWTPLERLRPPAPRPTPQWALIRGISAPPEALPPRSPSDPEGWLVRGPGPGAVVRAIGPHVLEGGWWDTPIDRSYHYLETAAGHLLWVFHDARRQRWFLHGVVE